MNVLERQARFMLWVIIITALLYLGVVPWVGFQKAFAMFGFFGFAGFTPLIGRKERKSGKIIMDERDREIERIATLAGYSVFWVFFVAAAMTPFFMYGPNAKMTIDTGLPCDILFIAMALIFFVRSLVIVMLYRKGRVANV